MKLFFAATAFVLMFPSLATAESRGKFRPDPHGVRDKYIVVLERGSSGAPVQQLANALARAHSGRLRKVFDQILGGFSVEMNEAQARRLSEDPRVAFVEQASYVAPATTQGTPGNPAPWGLTRIDQRYQPVDDYYNYYFSGLNVTAYVVDTGVNAVGDLVGRVSRHENFSPDGNAADCLAHGTSVASSLGGVTYGVAKDVTLVNVKVLGCTPSDVEHVIAGLAFVRNEHQAGQLAVANVSLGMNNPQISAAWDAAILDLVADGVVVVVASGNNNVDAQLTSPGRTGCPSNGISAISVGATNRADARAVFNATQASNFGPCVDVFAPGDEIPATNPWGGIDQDWDGTSAAAPHVAGVAALHLQRFGNVTPGMIENAIVEHATLGIVTNITPDTPNRFIINGLPRTRICCIY